MRKALAYLVLSTLAVVFFTAAILALYQGIVVGFSLLDTTYLNTATMLLCVAAVALLCLFGTVCMGAASYAAVWAMVQGYKEDNTFEMLRQHDLDMLLDAYDGDWFYVPDQGQEALDELIKYQEYCLGCDACTFTGDYAHTCQK